MNGIPEVPVDGKLYLDTNLLIAWMEEIPPYGEPLAELIESQSHTVVSSELSVAECLVQPFKQKNTVAANAYLELLDREVITFYHVSRTILIQSAEKRSQYSLKLPDAIHIATAIFHDCAAFLTCDRDFRKVSDIPVLFFE
ncbi:MAG: type II toxin-antitoxin system VapC family toxin [Candidatus Hydrogenedentes bacterium]|nr:type II toxin-antitoxin system VapC family toxin [Candidatus Hydrogenedentota bacterium]